MEEHTRGAQLPSVMALAYLGDAEYAVFVRRMLIDEGISHAGELNRRSLLYVTAERQAAVMRCLEEHLTEDERDVFRRARNHSNLHRPRHASIMDYRYATGLEAVLGMRSYLGDRARLEALFALCRDITYRLGVQSDTNDERNRKETIQ